MGPGQQLASDAASASERREVPASDPAELAAYAASSDSADQREPAFVEVGAAVSQPATEESDHVVDDAGPDDGLSPFDSGGPFDPGDFDEFGSDDEVHLDAA